MISLDGIQAYIGLGANLGDPARTLQEALVRMRGCDGISLQRVSSFYRTAPVEALGDDFINAVSLVVTTLSKEALLETLLGIENALGRVRPRGVVHAPRTLDLDLLLYGDEISASCELTLPHPRMHERAFVLIPLLEIAPEVVIPGKGMARDWLGSVKGQRVERLTVAPS